jgi:CO/xanthine dehydrogenase FAD-binding subunit
MILEYHRPDNLEDLITLLSRKSPETIILGGGLFINEVIKDPIAVVDIQGIGLDGIKKKGKRMQYGAAVKLQSIINDPDTPQALKEAIKHQENRNRRQVATLAGTLVAAGGRSAIAGVLLALDAELEIAGKGKKVEKVFLGDFLPLRAEMITGKVITTISIPADVRVAYQYVARSPADLPIVAAAAALWPSGRIRTVLLGFGDQPRMVFDGPDGEGVKAAARDAYSEAGDQWASAEYRSETAGILAMRCLDELSTSIKD